MQQVEISKANLDELIKSVNKGEEIVLTDNNKPIAKLIPVINEITKPQFGSARGLITMSDDFDEPLEDFEEYMK